MQQLSKYGLTCIFANELFTLEEQRVSESAIGAQRFRECQQMQQLSKYGLTCIFANELFTLEEQSFRKRYMCTTIQRVPTNATVEQIWVNMHLRE
jgi:hypothetical protein